MFDDEKQEWDIPYFYLKAKEVQLPQLSRNKGRDLVEQEKEMREVEFNHPPSIENSFERKNPMDNMKFGNYHSSGQLADNMNPFDQKYQDKMYLQNSNNLAPPPSIKNELASYGGKKNSPRYKDILDGKISKKTGKLTSLNHHPPNPFGEDEERIDLHKVDKKTIMEVLNEHSNKNTPVHPSLKAGSLPRNSKANVKLRPLFNEPGRD
jgi:hypothetical protein